MKQFAFVALAVVLAALCGPALAQKTFTGTTVNVRAGPGPAYPVVAVVSPGLRISVQGCTADFRWCDVQAGPSRGWMYAGNINYLSDEGATSPLLNWDSQQTGIPVISFGLENYWTQHYRDRPWYRDRGRWAQPGGPPPRGYGRPGYPPGSPAMPYNR